MQNSSKINVSEYVSKLFAETDENHVLSVEAWPVDNPKEPFYKYNSCTMNWTEESSKQAAKEISDYCQKIEELADKVKENTDYQFSESEQSFYTKYLCPLKSSVDIGHFEEEGTIDYKVFFGETLSKEETETYEKYKEDIFDKAIERLGDNDFSYEVIIRSSRLFKLLTIGAPTIVSDLDKRILIEALAMYKYGVDNTFSETGMLR